MKLKKVQKLLPPWEHIRVWGRDEEIPIYDGAVSDIPWIYSGLKLEKGPGGAYFDIRYHNSDIEDHVAVFVEYEDE